MESDNKPKKDDAASFTVDSDSNTGQMDMPSVTKLLNRKSLTSKKATPPSPPGPPSNPSRNSPPPSFPPAMPPSHVPVNDPPTSLPEPISTEKEESSGLVLSEAPLEIEIQSSSPANPSEPGPSKEPSQPFTIETSAGPKTEPTNQSKPSSDQPKVHLETKLSASATPSISIDLSPSKMSPPKIQPNTSRRGSKTASQLIIWDPTLLKTGFDPMGKGIALLLEKGAYSALFLAITPPPAGSPVPHFLSVAAVLPKDKLVTWTGLKWDPTVVPELWNYFVQTGVAELSPPGTTTNQSSNRNMVRAAFGLSRAEWLLLVRAGSAKACRGVVAFVSTKTLMQETTSALPLLSKEFVKAA